MKKLIDLITNQFALPLTSIHGRAHWDRVRENGLRLAQRTGAESAVVVLFAVLHDSKRLDDGLDLHHGKRAAEFVKSLRGTMITLADEYFEHLVYACEFHTDGLTEGNITVQTCWDADRLDLGRIGIRPDPQYLCTDAAKDPAMIAWAFKRSLEF
jgi:uncharacterized protein